MHSLLVFLHANAVVNLGRRVSVQLLAHLLDHGCTLAPRFRYLNEIDCS